MPASYKLGRYIHSLMDAFEVADQSEIAVLAAFFLLLDRSWNLNIAIVLVLRDSAARP